ncbi:MAG TPA: DUF3108 domain-containing protein [Candidatus Krumholzibacteria bacterium]|nr:DUF3108 domain-containing protein [Candidatus Krumholzibacteria bacterium]HPD71730.1 DUF3108 domain-containing protein [Candidatus Krumholzibacteria bacterium]HRY41337.1 DUF3108 domain-containing protein [Candidatus Krumholzibacteria bacterium]
MNHAVRLLLAALVAALAGSSLAAGAAGQALPDSTSRSDVESDSTTVRALAAPPFAIGERLVFSLDYGPVNAGEGVLEVVGLVDVQGRPCYRIESTATSNRFFSGFYKVRDKVISYVDREGLFSRYFMKRLREGTYRKTEEIEFDHAAGLARYDNGKVYDITPGVHDVLSAFYFVRTLDLEVGRDVFLSAHSSRKTYDMRVIVHRQEAVETDFGTFDCFVIQPIMMDEGLFKHEGDLMIYLTADDRRIPVLMTTKLPVGNIAAHLREHEPGRPAGGEGD